MSESTQSLLAAALAVRAAQVPVVQNVGRRWAQLLQAYDRMAADVEAVTAVAHAVPDPDGAADALHAPTTGDPSRLAALRRRIVAVQGRLAALESRVTRQTVNLSVIGHTRVGKSTLLRAVIGGPDQASRELLDQILPSETFRPTTAAASRVYHADGPARAVLHTYDWRGFRDRVLRPLYAEASAHGDTLPRFPEQLDDFVGATFPAREHASAGATPAVQILREAHDALGSYRHLLGDQQRAVPVPVPQLREYVARPKDENSRHRPYFGVRSVEIHAHFPTAGNVRLGLIDLPGTGEAGVDVEGRFVTPMRHDVDLFLLVLRPDAQSAFVKGQGSANKLLALAERASLGVPLPLAVMVVVNADAHAHAGAVDEVMKELPSAEKFGRLPRVRVDAADPADVDTQLLQPVLRHLADHLAEMDLAAIRTCLHDAAVVLDEVAGLAQECARHQATLASRIPRRDHRLLRRATELRDGLASELVAAVDEFDVMVADGKADSHLAAAIDAAVASMRRWVAEGFGKGTREKWVEWASDQLVAREAAFKEREFVRVRRSLGAFCDTLDASGEHSARMLRARVAGVLRGRLGADLIPDGDGGLPALADAAAQAGAPELARALRDLDGFRVGYGSIVLRVTRPVLRTVDWKYRRVLALPLQDQGGLGQPVGVGPAMTQVDVVQLGRAVANAMGRPGSGAPGAPALGGEGQRFAREIDRLYEGLQAIANDRIDVLGQALHGEARRVASVLAAVVERFRDAAVHIHLIEEEYRNLCAEHEQTLWPDPEGDVTAQLGGALEALRSSSALVLDAAGQARTLPTG